MDMERALGQFVTEIGVVENVMFETILAVVTEAANEVHKKFYSQTFGPKVEMLEKITKHAAFDEHRAGIVHLVRMLKMLVSQRNNIVHGETFHITRRRESKTFRVGFTRKNLAPWTDFDFVGNAENIFTTEQIDKVVTDCIAVKTDLNWIRNKVVKSLTGVEPPYVTHSFELD
jgi:hypothetical protein